MYFFLFQHKSVLCYFRTNFDSWSILKYIFRILSIRFKNENWNRRNSGMWKFYSLLSLFLKRWLSGGSFALILVKDGAFLWIIDNLSDFFQFMHLETLWIIFIINSWSFIDETYNWVIIRKNYNLLGLRSLPFKSQRQMPSNLIIRNDVS